MARERASQVASTIESNVFSTSRKRQPTVEIRPTSCGVYIYFKNIPAEAIGDRVDVSVEGGKIIFRRVEEGGWHVDKFQFMGREMLRVRIRRGRAARLGIPLVKLSLPAAVDDGMVVAVIPVYLRRVIEGAMVGA